MGEMTYADTGRIRMWALAGSRKAAPVVVNAITLCYRCENCLRGYSSQSTPGQWRPREPVTKSGSSDNFDLPY